MTINNRKTERIAHFDIFHPNRLTDEQIASIPLNTVFQWVKENKWSFKHFEKYMTIKNRSNHD